MLGLSCLLTMSMASTACVDLHRCAGGGGTELWVQKYRPRRSDELCGNPGHVSTLREWLLHWRAPACCFPLSLSVCCLSQNQGLTDRV